MGPSLIAAGFAVACLGLGFALGRRLRPSSWPSLGASWPEVSVIIPARNEAHNLPRLLNSVQRQVIRPREILVIDDASTDGTATVAERHGARVITAGPLPPGWRGKSWACYQGARVAQGECLLFVDADTWFEPGGMDRLVAWWVAVRGSAQTAAGAGLTGYALSAGPYHRVEAVHEQMSLFFNLCMTVGTVPDRLFGPLMLVGREDYIRAGGHARVRGQILEHYFLTDILRTGGVQIRSAPGRGLVSFRMYPGGWRELIEGWTKGFAAGAGAVSPAILVCTVGWMVGLMLVPLGWALWPADPVWVVLYGACVVQVYGLARCVGSFHPVTALLYPLPLLFFYAVMWWSALRRGRPVTWKEREIPGS